jgi:hypothetical protein
LGLGCPIEVIKKENAFFSFLMSGVRENALGLHPPKR